MPTPPQILFSICCFIIPMLFIQMFKSSHQSVETAIVNSVTKWSRAAKTGFRLTGGALLFLLKLLITAHLYRTVEVRSLRVWCRT